MSQSISAMIIDDSATVRQVVSEILEEDPDFTTIQTAHDAVFAARKMQKSWPDVIILDMEMPRKDGLTFLKEIMAERPTPVVVCSAFTPKGADLTLEALEAGAIECIPKPKLAVKNFLDEYAGSLRSKIKAAAMARLHRRPPVPAPRAGTDKDLAKNPAQKPGQIRGVEPDYGLLIDRSKPELLPGGPLIAIGASTGGTSAIEHILRGAMADLPPIVIAQHMPAGFTRAFAGRLNQICPQTVKEGQHGEPLRYGHVYVAPGDQHMRIRPEKGKMVVVLDEGPKINRHRPSVDALFESVAEYDASHRLGLLLTGMGADGAKGLLAMRTSGANTACQDEDSCVVYGMPAEGVKIGAANKSLSLSDMSAEICQFATSAVSKAVR